nr:hypothetical protein BaRGS_030116 [Batillaria attramentaria]
MGGMIMCFANQSSMGSAMVCMTLDPPVVFANNTTVIPPSANASLNPYKFYWDKTTQGWVHSSLFVGYYISQLPSVGFACLVSDLPSQNKRIGRRERLYIERAVGAAGGHGHKKKTDADAPLTPGQEALYIILYVLACILMAFAYVSWITNPVDLSPAYTGFIASVCETGAMWIAIAVPILIENITKHKTAEEWRTVFYITGGLQLATFIFYLIFGSSELQPWGRPDDMPPITVTCKAADDDDKIAIVSSEHQERAKIALKVFKENMAQAPVGGTIVGGQSGQGLDTVVRSVMETNYRVSVGILVENWTHFNLDDTRSRVDDKVEVVGTMGGTHEAVIKITVRPKNMARADLAPGLRDDYPQ